MKEVEWLRRKGAVSLKEPTQKGIGSETGIRWGVLGIPTIWTVLILRGRGYCIAVGLNTESVASMSIRTETNSQSGEWFLQADWEGGLGRALADPSLRIVRPLEGLTRRQKVPWALKFITIFFPKPWLFAITAETRGEGGLALSKLKTENFSSLSFRWLIKDMQEPVCQINQIRRG